jgi:cobalt-zinc-cadmium efflux system outer membrane protein
MEEAVSTLTLRQALSLSLMKNPALAAFSWEVRAREAARLQASLLPNPELGVEMENLEGTGAMKGRSAMETTIQLSQLVELGGKRAKRERVAALDRDLAGWDYETKRLDIFIGATIAFIDVLYSQEHVALAGEMAHLAEQVHTTVSERVKAGKVSLLEEIKAEVSLSSSRIKAERAKRSLTAAKKRLAGYWGGKRPHFEKVKGELDELSSLPPFSQMVNMVSGNPDIARWAVEMESRRAALKLSAAGRIPDLTITGGYRRFKETDDNAFLLGVSFPLTIFNRNQGEIAEATHRLTKAKDERRTVEIEAQIELSEAYQRLSTAYSEAKALKNEILPGAQRAFDAASEGYRLGKFNFLDVLDAQRTLFEAKEQYLETIAAYHISIAEVERLIGVGLDKLPYTAKLNKKGDS